MAGDTIVFRDTQIGSSAVYQCNASNEHGYLLANAFVSVLGRCPRGQGSPVQLLHTWLGKENPRSGRQDPAGCQGMELSPAERCLLLL